MKFKNAPKNLERLTFGLEIKEIKQDPEDSDFFTFEGYASTFGNEDRGGDIVRPGAFLKTIADRKLSGELLPMLWQHNSNDPIGVFTELREDPKGLLVTGRMPKDDTFVSGKVVPQMKVGSIRKMSIGYVTKKSTIDETLDVRYLDEVELWETSLVTFPMNPQAGVTSMKNAFPFKELPIADHKTAWDPEAAKARVMESDVTKKDAFLGQFQIADVIDGKLTVIPQALIAAVAEVPEEAKDALAKHFEKMGSESPFQEKSCVRVDDVSQLSLRTLEKTLRKGVFFSQTEAKRLAKHLLSGSSERDAEGETERDADKFSNYLKSFNEELKKCRLSQKI